MTIRAMDVSWMDNAKCTKSNAELFSSPYREPYSDRRDREFQAKRICGMCAVQAACLDYALNSGRVDIGDDTIWGGQTGTERKRTRSGAKRSRRAG